MSVKDGGSAFPFVVRNDEDASEAGMSMRDYFAAHADRIETSMGVAEFLVGRERPQWKVSMQDNAKETLAHWLDVLQWEIELSAKLRFMYADAMLEVRK